MQPNPSTDPIIPQRRQPIPSARALAAQGGPQPAEPLARKRRNDDPEKDGQHQPKKAKKRPGKRELGAIEVMKRLTFFLIA